MKIKPTLTKRQKEILDYITTFIKENSYAPSYREIGAHFKLNSVATVAKHVRQLQNNGYLSAESHRKRSLTVPLVDLFEQPATVEIPLLGVIAAGEPIEAIAENERIAVPEELRGENDCYALKVRGDSMIEDGIFDGDYVIVERNYYPENGDVVVALIDNEKATLKRYYREDNMVRLQPANSKLEPIYVKNPAIQGRVRAVYRKYF